MLSSPRREKCTQTACPAASDPHPPDVAVLPEVKDDQRGWRLGRVVTVVDRGFSSKSNLDYAPRGSHSIDGERMRDGNAQAQAALSRQGRYRTVQDKLRVKEVTLASEPVVRWSSATIQSRPNATTPAAPRR